MSVLYTAYVPGAYADQNRRVRNPGTAIMYGVNHCADEEN